MRMVFMGTPEIAEAALDALLAAGHELAAVYTREDKPQGRKREMIPSPVKRRALENGIALRQPPSLRRPGAAEELAAFKPELVAVVAYGLILPPEVLAVPRHGCINLHVSLLPAYRGAAPIQWAVINGEKETGVTVMRMDEGLDTGPVLARQAIAIPPEATAGEMFGMATGIGARLLAQTVEDIAGGRAVAKPQEGQASYAPQLNKDMAEIDFTQPAGKLHNLARGCNPWPLAWFQSGGKAVKLLRARLSPLSGGVPGEILSLSPLTVACGEGALELLIVHPAGSRAMEGREWAAGRRFAVGESLSE